MDLIDLRDRDQHDAQPLPRLVTRLLTLLDDLGHQINLPDQLQDRLCARLDRRVAEQPERQAG